MNGQWKALALGCVIAVGAVSLRSTQDTDAHGQMATSSPSQGPQGAAGAAGVDAFGAPNARTLAFATAYQATNTSKPSIVGIEISNPLTAALLAPASSTVELIIGPTAAVASGTGTRVDVSQIDLSVSIALSLGFTSRQFLQASVPSGYYFAVRRVSGTTATIVSAYDQQVG